MRALVLVALLGCSNDVDPRVIPGGGVGDGEIDGEVNVFVIDESSEAPLTGATVAIGDSQKTTDAKGLVTFSDVEGPQTIAVKMTGYRNTVWVNVNGANVTIGLPANVGTPPQATLSGTIEGWNTISVAQGHLKVGSVLFSQTTDLGDDANNIQTPNMGNNCIDPNNCNWTLASRTGAVTVLAVIIDRDLKGTPFMPGDDTQTVLGYAFKTGVTVEEGINQSGLILTRVEAGNLETLTVDSGTPPASLTEFAAFVGIELSADEVIQLPLFLIDPDATSLLAPKRSVFGGTATYRLTAVSQTTSGDMGAQSIVLRQGLTEATLAAGEWLVPPTGVNATRTTASFDRVAGARIHTIQWQDNAGQDLLEMTAFDSSTTTFEVPNLVALPTSGMLTARAQAIGADFDPNDFSLEDDSDLLWGISAQPMNIP